ncbi:hypothetical protein GGX14DRAFT_386872 [Mycena pura]|uniref:Uncharacterized protein n=1 Tax=Mycena pura TaxID=153505 RepID=A0AAD6YML5_9AGAR|nr:hypothetical protein GGX14DRAFT_386872 [Mycena pura]
MSEARMAAKLRLGSPEFVKCANLRPLRAVQICLFQDVGLEGGHVEEPQLLLSGLGGVKLAHGHGGGVAVDGAEAGGGEHGEGHVDMVVVQVVDTLVKCFGEGHAGRDQAGGWGEGVFVVRDGDEGFGVRRVVWKTRRVFDVLGMLQSSLRVPSGDVGVFPSFGGFGEVLESRDDSGGSIRGTPGSGKTTTCLQLFDYILHNAPNDRVSHIEWWSQAGHYEDSLIKSCHRGDLKDPQCLLDHD